LKRLRKIYITLLLGTISGDKHIYETIPGYALSKVIYENLKYLKDDSKYVENLKRFFSHKKDAFNILVLNANFETKIGKEEYYRVRIEIDILDNEEDYIIRGIISDILIILDLGIDLVLIEEEKYIKKMIYIKESFKFYEIDFLNKENNKNLEKLLSFSWDGLKFDLLEDSEIFNDMNKFFKKSDLNFNKIVLSSKFYLVNGMLISNNIEDIKINFIKEMKNILKDMGGNYKVIDDFFSNGNDNIKSKDFIEFNIDLKSCVFSISILEYKNIDFIIGILIIILKDIFNNLFFIDDNIIFNNIEENFMIINKKISKDTEEKYLKALYEFCNK
jgi:hypothetical protein